MTHIRRFNTLMDPREGKVGVRGVGLRQSQTLLSKDVPQCSQMSASGSLCFRHYTPTVIYLTGFFFLLLLLSGEQGFWRGRGRGE